MAFENLSVDEQAGLVTLRLNRPRALNALHRPLFRELLEALLDAASSDSCRAVMLTGAGRAFCAGADLKHFHQDHLKPEEGHLGYKTPALLHEMMAAIMRLPKPVLAAVNGPAVGAGFPLAAAADLIVAAESAYFSLGYIQIGLSPDGSSTFRLPRTLGTHKTFELLALGERLTAAEAKTLGLVSRVLPDDTFAQKAQELGLRLAQLPTKALGVGKELILRSSEHSLETQLERETRGVMRTSSSHDFREGVQSFLQKRKPAFAGN